MVNEDEHRNLVEESDNTEKEEVPHNGVQGPTQGDKSSSDLDIEKEVLPHNIVQRITQGYESPSDCLMMASRSGCHECVLFVHTYLIVANANV